MSTTMFDAAAANTTLFSAVLGAMRTFGKNRDVLVDVEKSPLTYGRLVLGSLVLGDKIAGRTKRGETVGVLLPNVNGLPVTVLALNAYGRIAALLNFTAGAKNLRSALQTAVVSTVLTSRRFIDQAKLEDVVKALAETEYSPGKKVRIVYLEDMRKTIGTFDKIKGVLRSTVAAQVHRSHALRPDQPAVVLFTSGTEGSPKGVVLSNANLVANARQIFSHASGILNSSDIVVNPLPMFHSFGLTAATLMPMLNGMKIALYPSPLHYKQIPALVRETNATLLFATDTFLQGYARSAEEGDLKSLRFVIAGAEKVKDQTRALWAKSGATILEGYGATECSPVLACNLPETNTPGTVGRLLPGMSHKLEMVDGIASGGALVVKGPNVMAGYMYADKPGVIVPPKDGWYDTGDIVTVDDQGLVAIRGRAKRFAKIGGEMISLAAVETMVSGLWPESNHVVVSVPDPRKGEQLVLVTEKTDAGKDALLACARTEGVPELWVPRSIIVVPQIPLLGSGKTDFPATIEMVKHARTAA
jgi:acyl-[acyl-carrier-protein]-phospholipid O-acyltransferase / long-chain-fatty-acid--[acyl-carrier-protein] ligase